MTGCIHQYYLKFIQLPCWHHQSTRLVSPLPVIELFPMCVFLQFPLLKHLWPQLTCLKFAPILTYIICALLTGEVLSLSKCGEEMDSCHLWWKWIFLLLESFFWQSSYIQIVVVDIVMCCLIPPDLCHLCKLAASEKSCYGHPCHLRIPFIKLYSILLGFSWRRTLQQLEKSNGWSWELF